MTSQQATEVEHLGPISESGTVRGAPPVNIGAEVMESSPTLSLQDCSPHRASVRGDATSTFVRAACNYSFRMASTLVGEGKR